MRSFWRIDIVLLQQPDTTCAAGHCTNVLGFAGGGSSAERLALAAIKCWHRW
jgi:hypothetical protein